MIRSGPGEVEIRIRDHGKGIAPSALDKLFDRFFKVDAARGRSEGSGLGLSIVAKNVELHGGMVIARNADGGGAEFVVILPLSNHAEES